jgi:hypothetical protein
MQTIRGNFGTNCVLPKAVQNQQITGNTGSSGFPQVKAFAQALRGSRISAETGAANGAIRDTNGSG